MMAANHALLEDDRIFGFHVNAHYLKQVITECIISMFNHQLSGFTRKTPMWAHTHTHTHTNTHTRTQTNKQTHTQHDWTCLGTSVHSRFRTTLLSMYWMRNCRPPPSRSSGTTSKQRNTECKVQSVSAVQAALARPSCGTTAGRTLLLGHGNSWFLRHTFICSYPTCFFWGQSAPVHSQSDHVYMTAVLINATCSACVHGSR